MLTCIQGPLQVSRECHRRGHTQQQWREVILRYFHRVERVRSPCGRSNRSEVTRGTWSVAVRMLTTMGAKYALVVVWAAAMDNGYILLLPTLPTLPRTVCSVAGQKADANLNMINLDQNYEDSRPQLSGPVR